MNTVSIIMPAYNVENYISCAIESVINQTYKNWQLIIVNDGSNDNSRKIAKKYELSDNRIQVVDKTNGGLSDARNEGLRFVKGDYLCFIDSDDWIEPDFLDNMISAIEKSSADIVVCGYYVDNIDIEGNLITRSVHNSLNRGLSVNKDYITFMEEYANFAWNKLYRRRFITDNELFFEKGLWLIEDCEFFSRVLSYKPRIKFIDYAGNHYNNRIDVTLSKKYDGRVMDIIKRKIGLYESVLMGLGADRQYYLNSTGRIKASNISYLILQMAKNLTFSDFSNKIKELFKQDLLSPDSIRLGDCSNFKDRVVICLTRFRCIHFLHLIVNH